MDQQVCASVNHLCSLLNESAVRAEQEVSSLTARKQAALQQIKQQHPNSPGFVPSGPRKRGEGCDDEIQGILEAQETATGGARLRISLLAAGFVIGPGGSSIRSVSQSTGADIRSWSETSSILGRQRRVRCIVIEGSKLAVYEALACLCDAVDRYKELCEGKYCGQAVDRVQRIRGIGFYYSPPPRSAVPYAAALKPDSSSACYSGKENSINVTNKCHPASTRDDVKVRPSARSGNQLWPLSPSLETKVDAFNKCSMENIDGRRGDGQVPPLSTQSTQPPSWTFPSKFSYTLDKNETHQADNLRVNINSDGIGLFSSPSSSQTELWGAIGTEPGLYQSFVPIIPSAPITPHINTSAVSGVNDVEKMVKVPHRAPHKALANNGEYTLFGGQECRVGPRLLRDLWDTNDSRIPVSPLRYSLGWRGNPVVGVPDESLGLLALPSYSEFAEKSPYYHAPMNAHHATANEALAHTIVQDEVKHDDHVTDFGDDYINSQFDTDMQESSE